MWQGTPDSCLRGVRMRDSIPRIPCFHFRNVSEYSCLLSARSGRNTCRAQLDCSNLACELEEAILLLVSQEHMPGLSGQIPTGLPGPHMFALSGQHLSDLSRQHMFGFSRQQI